MANNKKTRAFNMELLTSATIKNLTEDHIQALNLDYDRYTWAYTQDGCVLVVDDRGQRYCLHDDGTVYAARFVRGKWVYKNKAMQQGEYSYRPQDYGNMPLTITRLDCDYNLTVGIHRMMALTFDRAGFNRARSLGISDSDLVVNHKDNCGFHNSPSNLEWCSQKDNCLHYTYVNTQVLLDPSVATDVVQRYLREGVSVHTIKFCLCLYKSVGMEGGAMASALSNINNYDVHKLLADPWTMPEVKRACSWFLNKPGCVSSDDITRDFVENFDKYKNIEIIF